MMCQCPSTSLHHYFAAKAELDPFFIHLLLRQLIIKGFTMLMTISSLVSSSVNTLQRAAQNVKDLISAGTGAIYNALQTLFSRHHPPTTPSTPVTLTGYVIWNNSETNFDEALSVSRFDEGTEDALAQKSYTQEDKARTNHHHKGSAIVTQARGYK
jgi:hypothetical protein